MTEVFLGQIMLTGFGFAPRGFAMCNGQLLPINQNQALFSLLGTSYGGNGTTNFALPNLMGRTPVGFGNSVGGGWNPTPYALGQVGGSENVTLTAAQLPSHNHLATGTTATGNLRNPTNGLYGVAGANIYAQTGGPQVALSPNSVAPVGGNAPHENMQPYRAINFNIALNGTFPSRD